MKVWSCCPEVFVPGNVNVSTPLEILDTNDPKSTPVADFQSTGEIGKVLALGDTFTGVDVKSIDTVCAGVVPEGTVNTNAIVIDC